MTVKSLRRSLALLAWHSFGRSLPGHGHKSVLGRVRSSIGRACLAKAGPRSVIGPRADFGNGSNVAMGSDSGIAEGSVVKGGAPISIGNRVVMGPRVLILSSTHRYAIEGGTWCEERLSRPITIHDECFIGAGAIILAGVSIGPRVIVAAGSVVTSDVPEGKIAGGVPARLIGDVPVRE